MSRVGDKMEARRYSVKPITVKAARLWCREVHRHLPNVQGGLFATSVHDQSGCVAVGIAGNPARVWQGTGRVVVSRVAALERQRRWRERHPEQSKSRCRDYHDRKRDAVLDRKKQYYQDVRKAADKTAEGRLKDRNRKARRRSLSKSGHITVEEWESILTAHDHRCAYCGTCDLALEMDHVIPLSKGGQHCATNIVPACKPCNSKKGAR